MLLLFFATCQSNTSAFLSLSLLRLTPELGGIYFSFNVVLNIVSCWVSAWLYSDNYDGRPNDRSKLADSEIFVFLGVLLFVWALTVIIFFFTIKRAYWQTFYSTQTGRDNTKANFLDNEGNDQARIMIFSDNIDLWRDIEGEVQVWTLANWARWEHEKPSWFDENFRESVPDRFRPIRSLVQLKSSKVHSPNGKMRESVSTSVVPVN